MNYYIQITATDALSFRKFIRRNPDAIIEACHRGTKAHGMTRSKMKKIIPYFLGPMQFVIYLFILFQIGWMIFR